MELLSFSSTDFARLSSDEESFELIDSLDVETTEYVLPDVAEEALEGLDSISNNHSDHSVFQPSLGAPDKQGAHKTSAVKAESRVRDQTRVKKTEATCINASNNSSISSTSKQGLENSTDKRINHLRDIGSVTQKSENVQISNKEEHIVVEEFHNFNHFTLLGKTNDEKFSGRNDELIGKHQSNLNVKSDEKVEVNSDSGRFFIEQGCDKTPFVESADQCCEEDFITCQTLHDTTHRQCQKCLQSTSDHSKNKLDLKLSSSFVGNKTHDCNVDQMTPDSKHNCGQLEIISSIDLHDTCSCQQPSNIKNTHEGNQIMSNSYEQIILGEGEFVIPGKAVPVRESDKKMSLHLDCNIANSGDAGAECDGMFSPAFKREKPLCREDFNKLFDEDGRLVDEHALRKAVFMGGVDPSIRKEVWHFLFGLFPCSSTTREREDLLIDYIMKYHEQKSRWKTMLMLNAKPGASLLEQGLVARYQIDTSNKGVRSPDGDIHDPISEFEVLQSNLKAGKMKSGDPDFKALSKNFPNLDISSPELKQKIDFMRIQAQVLVNRQNINVRNLWSQLRVVDKDVPRTDRDQDYFKGALNPNLTVLREILLTFSAFYPKIGYAQGMNDILARFLVVFDSEVETYWCFSNYMSKIQHDFTEDGMVRKIELVVELLEEMDLELLSHLRKHDMGDLMFCHRWLLLGFKREMSFIDSLRCFEILSSHHLELSSLEAENARRRQTMKEFENLGGITRTLRLDTQCDYTFELFMCLALLEECRGELLLSTDTAAVFTVINNLSIDLDDILCKSADLFYKYCKKSVDDSFLMVELPPNFKRRQKQKLQK